jgi:hypothetical protein
LAAHNKSPSICSGNAVGRELALRSPLLQGFYQGQAAA